ncbi:MULTISPECIES: hypothetical protein [Dehalococcoides]|jgi:hypothetical protein|uniref:hypothetical protein n=1 Tax=Dehalococcoides TaxID=61434 RepID=UPI0003C816CE|nr:MULTISPECIES: hypothetical protein [Dehalococcoides]AHB13832.1 hypothetical protein GY50_1059 [Dehalococcoides mccartyi GY50]AII58194.1 hypothetical protein X792_05725 [Dehalococcoides mccartyi CG1]QYY58834.2 hypothetical protein CWV2_001062 [Dehalococcoides mccartyi]BAQ34958.1 hypothetical protein UCH007_10000 [Dehalococcoides sp. UCH007]
MNAKFLALFITICLLVQPLTGCLSTGQCGFRLVLMDSAKVLLTDQDISGFNCTECALILSKSGIEKWNAYLGYSDIPKLSNGLYSKDFIIRIDDEEICRGKFWSSVSSTSTEGVIITDCVMELTSSFNCIYLQINYPACQPLEEAITAKIRGYFENRNISS